jgi:hypothetical protein
VETSTILLHDNARHDVLERFVQLGQLIQAQLYDTRCPLVDLVVLVGTASNYALHSLLRYNINRFNLNNSQEKRSCRCSLTHRPSSLHKVFYFLIMNDEMVVAYLFNDVADFVNNKRALQYSDKMFYREDRRIMYVIKWIMLSKI